MKIKVDVDATPEELRVFFGFPDIKPLQDEMLEVVRKRMHEGVEGYDPMVLLKPFMPQGMQGLDTMQKFFWDAFRQNMEGTTGSGSQDKDKK
ncbi:hypothetical protein H0Z60_17700 [Ectothiorhodospiraceae bacterium WFHF3C12]|nr:hypothetical protein [Ectothiorhodospiraceae bacterium WFHF3C12]